MAKRCLALTVTEIKNAKSKGTNHTLSDGNGLYLIVRPTGTKTFIFKYSHLVTSQRITLSLGTFPQMSLLDARDKASELRKLLAKNIDPQRNKQEIKRNEQLRLNTTLQAVAENWLEIKKTRVTATFFTSVKTCQSLYAYALLNRIPVTFNGAPIRSSWRSME